MKKRNLIPLILLFFSLFSCQDNKSENVIFTSFYPIYDFTKRIVGDHFDVVNLTPPGVEPHDFELSTKQVASFYDGKALFLNGIGMEYWSDSLPNDLKGKTYTVTDNIEIRKEDGIEDPHVWLTPLNAIAEMKDILSIINTLDPTHKEDYEKNYQKAEQEFLSLHEEIKEKRKTFTQNKLVVAHAAFGYFCQEYDLEQIAVHGLEPEEEPTAKEIENILDLVKEYNINTIFTEEMASQEIAEKISQETGCKLEVLSPIESLEEEEVGKEDYLSLMRENLEKIEEACK